jgi:RimJ/RimL family protein N-acetyltransferase
MTASHLARNPASGRVMEKCGLTLVQSVTREHRGRQEPFCIRGITRDAWERWSA